MLFAQTATIRGFVFEKGSQEPVLFTNVVLKGTVYGAQTDAEGFYTIASVPAGDYVMMVTCLGYDSLTLPITVKENEIINKKLLIVKKSVSLPTFNVSAERQAAKTEIKISIIPATPRELKMVPAVGGEAELAQYLQTLPGVIFTGDQGGQLYIRGGTPIQNKVLLDGMVIYNPFHSIGLFSVFDTDVIRKVNVMTGGFNAEYGGRISSVMDITTREGNKMRFAGKVSSSPFTSKLIFEGPIKRPDSLGGGSSSFLINMKTSYLQQTSKVLYNYIDTTGQGLPYNFADLYGKLSLTNANGSKLNFFGFNFTDNVKYPDVSTLKWSSNGFGSNFVLIPGSSQVRIDGTFAYSKYAISLLEATDAHPRSSEINGFNMGLNFTYFINKDEIKYGLEVLGFRTNFDFFNSINLEISQTDNTSELGGFVKYKKVIGKLLLEPSVRLAYYGSLGEFSPEPRLGMKFNVTEKFRLKFSGGFYTQNLLSASSDRDVVNLFYGFLSGSDNVPEKFDGKDVTSKLQKSTHGIGGFEVDLPNHFDLNVEGYIKDFPQLTNLNRDKVYDDNADNASKPDNVKKDFIIENGEAHGLDFLLKYDYKRVYLWAVYSLGYVTRYDGIRTYMPHFDRRHNVNLVLSYTFGKKLNWEFDARWNFGSGFPFTQTQGDFEHLNFSQGVNTNYTTANGQLGTILGDLNAGRLPTYHRLDITIKKKWEISKNSALEANVNVINAYNRQNIFYVDRITNQVKYQLPLLPSAGISLTF